MIDQSLPFPGMGDREWGLWLELWRQAARRAELRVVARALYERYEDWFAEVVADGIAAGEFLADDRTRPSRSASSPRSTASACASWSTTRAWASRTRAGWSSSSSRRSSGRRGGVRAA